MPLEVNFDFGVVPKNQAAVGEHHLERAMYAMLFVGLAITPATIIDQEKLREKNGQVQNITPREALELLKKNLQEARKESEKASEMTPELSESLSAFEKKLDDMLKKPTVTREEALLLVDELAQMNLRGPPVLRLKSSDPEEDMDDTRGPTLALLLVGLLIALLMQPLRSGRR